MEKANLKIFALAYLCWKLFFKYLIKSQIKIILAFSSVSMLFANINLFPSREYSKSSTHWCRLWRDHFSNAKSSTHWNCVVSLLATLTQPVIRHYGVVCYAEHNLACKFAVTTTAKPSTTTLTTTSVAATTVQTTSVDATSVETTSSLITTSTYVTIFVDYTTDLIIPTDFEL